MLQGRCDEAESLLQRALAAEREGFGEEHPAVAETLRVLGLTLAAQVRFAQTRPKQAPGTVAVRRPS